MIKPLHLPVYDRDGHTVILYNYQTIVPMGQGGHSEMVLYCMGYVNGGELGTRMRKIMDVFRESWGEL